MFKFLPEHVRVDAQLLRNLVRQFVADDAAGHTLDVREQVVDGFHLAFGRAHRELRAGTLDQVIEVAAAMRAAPRRMRLCLYGECRGQDRNRARGSAP